MNSASPGICGLYPLTSPLSPSHPSPISLLSYLISLIPPSLHTHFSLTPGLISRIVLATNDPFPGYLIHAIARAFAVENNPEISISACIGAGIAVIQAIWDVSDWIESGGSRFGLVIAADSGGGGEVGIVYAVIGKNPAIFIGKRRVLYTIDEKFGEKMSELEAFLEAIDFYQRPFPPTYSLLSSFNGLILTPSSQSTDLFLQLIHQDMVRNPLMYGDIGRISQALDLSNPHHSYMIQNWSQDVSREKLRVGGWGRGGFGGNSELFSALMEWAISGDMAGKRLLAVCRGEPRQYAVVDFESPLGCSDRLKSLKSQLPPHTPLPKL